MFDFHSNIAEQAQGRVLLCAHRGLSSANIPCNTMPAFQAALAEGADMIELDVAISRDKRLYVFHPGMERPHLHSLLPISKMNSSRVEKLRFLNQDDCKTFLKINTLEEILDFLKGKCYINVDKFWTDVPGITNAIRRCGVEEQVIVKTPIKKKVLREVASYAPDLMFMPIVRHTDTITDSLIKQGIRCIGAEVLFETEDAPVASAEYIESMHKKGMLLFANAIVYNSKDVLSAGHSDDSAIGVSPDFGWGWLIDRGFDIIQTDWCGMMRRYMERR